MFKNILTVSAALAGLATAASAAILFTGPSYNQTFDSLQNSPNVDANGSGAPAWTNNSTLAGWYGGGSSTLASAYGVGNGSDNTMLSTGTVAVASFGTTGNSDRALAPLKRNNSAFIALALTNNTSITLNELIISYTGEQWRDNASQSAGSVALDFSYQIGATDTTSGTWTDVNTLDFIAPKTSGSGTLDGNLSENRAAISATINGLNLEIGQTIWLRWEQRGTGNNGSYVAVDDLTVVPEPSTYALGLGLLCLGFVLVRRRRKS